METTREEVLEKIAEENGLKIIETTSEANGYPRNLKTAVIGFETFEQVEELARKHDLDIGSFEKRDGWGLWARKGINVHEPFNLDYTYYGDNYALLERMDEENFIESEIEWFFEDKNKTIEEMVMFLEEKREVWEEINELGEGEVVVTYEGGYYETSKLKTMSFYHDTRHYEIGLI